MISSQLDREGFQDSRWKELFVLKIAEDTGKLAEKGMSFDEALDYLLSGIDREKVPLLEDVYPNFRTLRVYKSLARVGTYMAILLCLSGIVFLALSYIIGLPLLFTGLMFFLFAVFPLRFFSGSIKQKQDNVYMAIFRLHLK